MTLQESKKLIMATLTTILGMVGFLFLVFGLINPSRAIFWSKNPTRLKVLLIFIAYSVIIAITMPKSTKSDDLGAETTKKVLEKDIDRRYIDRRYDEMMRKLLEEEMQTSPEEDLAFVAMVLGMLGFLTFVVWLISPSQYASRVIFWHGLLQDIAIFWSKNRRLIKLLLITCLPYLVLWFIGFFLTTDDLVIAYCIGGAHVWLVFVALFTMIKNHR